MDRIARHGRDDLSDRAERLWPDSPVLQAKWKDAVALVRSCRKGWLLDKGPHRARQAR